MVRRGCLLALLTVLCLLGTSLPADSAVSPTPTPTPVTDPAGRTGSCTASRVTDSCSGSTLTLTSTSLSFSFTVNPVNPVCTGGNGPACVFSWFVQPSNSGYNGPAGQSVTCGEVTTSTPFNVSATGPLSCTASWSWSSADGTAYPTSFTVNVIEDSGGGPQLPDRTHGFSATRDRPAPVAGFTASPGDATGEWVFHSTSTSRLGGLHWSWDFGDGSFGLGEDVTHTFEEPGTYDVELDVSDAGPYSDSVVQPVDRDATGGPSTSIVLHVETLPASDAGRFDLGVDGVRRLRSGADGDQVVVAVSPGSHVVTQTATTVAQSRYDVRLRCTSGGRTLVSAPTVRASVRVPANARVDCTFTNKRTAKHHCVVPQLRGLTLTRATGRLRAAHCSLGKVDRVPGRRLVVAEFSPGLGSVRAAGAPVRLTLRPR